MALTSSLRRPAFVAWCAAFAALAALALHAGVGLGGPGTDAFFATWVYHAVVVFAALACVARAVVVPGERAAWAVLGLALTAWAGGELYHTAFLADLEITPFPSLSDAFFVVFYPACFAGLTLLVRLRVRALGLSLLLDGLIAALAVSAVAAVFIFDPVMETIGEGSPLEIATNLAYPVGDIVLLGAAVAALTLTGWRPGRTLLVLTAGLALTAVADAVFLLQTTAGTYEEGRLLDALWPAGVLLVGWASWQRARPVQLELRGWRQTALPIVFSLAAVAVLLLSNVADLNKVAVGLATATVVAVIARMVWSLRDNVRLLDAARTEALTDVLTGLGNRRLLAGDLHRAVATASPSSPCLLVVFDIDGFKAYNDTFGHPAGDRLLNRLGHALGTAITPHGTAYRLGGDEFCVLLPGAQAGTEGVVAAAVDALSERGEGFAVKPSWGAVVVPREATNASLALQIADQRMYAHKGGRASSARKQSTDLLLGVLRERQAELHDHSSGVAGLAIHVGQRLGMTPEEIDEMACAAELHDIGKIAIPEAILDKPAPLNVDEWQAMHKHTLVGERILSAAPALAPVGRIVRASHERWDGHGYPDGIHGEGIPLGARIVAVCDAYDAMTSDRPYRKAVGREEALVELRRCSGSQFDPRVVEAFCAAVSRQPVPRAGEPVRTGALEPAAA